MNSLSASVKNNSWLIILAGIITSFIFPELGFVIKPHLNSLLIALMFLSCLDLRLSEIINSLGDYFNIGLMLLIVHLASPLLVYLLKDYFTPEIFLGLIIAATIPAGRSSVFLSNIYGGVPIKALVSTSISNFFSPLSVPFFVWLFAHTTIQVDPTDMSWTILKLVVIPLVLAILFGKTSAGKKLNDFSSSISVVILFFIILGIVSPLKSIVVANFQLSLILGLIISLLIIIDFCLGYLLGKSHSEKITYAISSSYKNYTLATLLSLTVFSPTVALPAIIYTIVSNILLIPLQFIFAPPKKSSHHRRRHHNLLLLITGVIAAIILANSPFFSQVISSLDSVPWLVAFIGGMLFASTFTLATGGLILIKLSAVYSPIFLIILGGIGAVTCDSIIFHLFRHKVSSHISPIYQELIHKSHLHRILHTHYFAWTLPVVGAFIMASPLPDELAISLLGISRTSFTKFFWMAFFSHLLGMSTLIAGTKIF